MKSKEKVLVFIITKIIFNPEIFSTFGCMLKILISDSRLAS